MKLTAKVSLIVIFSIFAGLLAPTLAQAATVKLTVTKTGTGTGTVVSTPAGISCGTTCSANFTTNTSVKLTVTAAAGSKFSAWSGACTGTTTTCTVVMSLAKTVTASFVPIPVKLTVTKAGTGAGTVTSIPAGISCGAACAANFNQNSAVTLTATAAAGSKLSSWSGGCAGPATTCTVTMSAAKTVTATFAPVPVALTVTKSGAGVGTVTSAPAGIDCGTTCTGNFNQNSSVTLTVTPAVGSTFGGWSGVCTGLASTCTVTMNQAQTVSTSFSLINTTLNVTTYHYDPIGNLTQVTDPLGHNRQIQYDSLDQPVRYLEPHSTVTGSTLGQIGTAYDSLGQVTQATDPRNLATDYQVDNLGNVLSQISPDTGTTQSTYDAAGNLKTRTDARGKVAAYTYDSQNRVIQVVYEDQTIAYTWDSCTNGIGRLCSLTNPNSTLNYSYDQHGRVTSKAQTMGTVTLSLNHSYNASGQIEQTITPSGRALGYVWLNDRIESVTLNGQPLISDIVYEPDGHIGGWTWGNGILSERLYDQAGRPVAISMGFDVQSQFPAIHNYSYDAANRITGIIDDIDPSLDQAYSYDGLDRLINSQQGTLAATTFDYDYDLSGNRTSKVVNNSTTETLTIDPASNRLQQKTGAQTVNYSYDLAGNLSGDGTRSYGYNAQGQRTSATATGLNAAYAYNALGQRVKKAVNGSTRLFVYDLQGRLMGEYGAAGQLLQETVWFGDLPIAVLKQNASQNTVVDVFYIHSDHLATPRRITRPSDNKVVWTWESEAFGDSQPNQDPSGLGEFAYNLRFPGQYYDQETGLHYNYFRDYDPSIGRYIQSDPIGLAGGINTYSYVGGNPVNWIDPLGLEATVVATPLPRGGFSFTATGTGLDGNITGTFNTGTTNFNQIQSGTYSVTPRPALPNSLSNWLFNRNKFAGRPTISNTSDWNTIRYPDGSVTKGAQIHPGRNGTNNGTSLACMVTDQSTYDTLNNLFKANYNNGGVSLIVKPVP